MERGRAVPSQAHNVFLRLEYEPHGFIETVGDAAGFVTRRVQGDLERFKEYIEGHGRETGVWRGTVKEH